VKTAFFYFWNANSQDTNFPKSNLYSGWLWSLTVDLNFSHISQNRLHSKVIRVDNGRFEGWNSSASLIYIHGVWEIHTDELPHRFQLKHALREYPSVSPEQVNFFPQFEDVNHSLFLWGVCLFSVSGRFVHRNRWNSHPRNQFCPGHYSMTWMDFPAQLSNPQLPLGATMTHYLDLIHPSVSWLWWSPWIICDQH